MPRTGISPLKFLKKNISEPKDVTVVIVTYLPDEYGYYEKKFDVLKLCLHSIWAHTDVPYDLMIVDNGSSEELITYLQEQFEQNLIQHLVLNRMNLGLMRGIAISIGAAPGKIVAYANDDVFFYPGWLSAHLRVLDAFPRVGFVSGEAVLGAGGDAVVQRIAQEYNISIEPYQIPDDRIDAWCYSVGLERAFFLNMDAVKQARHYKIERNGVKAISGDRCYAWVARKDFLQQLPIRDFGGPISSGMDAKWHESADELGYMRLSVWERMTAHIGNEMDETWLEWARKLGALEGNSRLVPVARAKTFLGHRRSFMKQVLLGNPVSSRLIYWLLYRLVEFTSGT